MTEVTKFSAISRSVVIFVFIFHLLKNEANKIDLLRERLKIILEGDGLVLANEVCIPYAIFKVVIFFSLPFFKLLKVSGKLCFGVHQKYES